MCPPHPSYHLRQEREVRGSAVWQEGTIILSPGASVHPQHGSHGRGGRGGARASLRGRLAGGSRPLAPVQVMRGAEELGVPQLREGHVRRRRARGGRTFRWSQRLKGAVVVVGGSRDPVSLWELLLSAAQVWHLRCGVRRARAAAGAPACGADGLIGSLLKQQAPPMPGAGD